MDDSCNDSLNALSVALNSIACFGERTQHHAIRVRHLVRAIRQTDYLDSEMSFERVKILSEMVEEEISHTLSLGEAVQIEAYNLLIERIDPMVERKVGQAFS